MGKSVNALFFLLSLWVWWDAGRFGQYCSVFMGGVGYDCKR
jgi:hypothetical protein